MLHTVAFSGQVGAAQTALTNIAAVADGTVRTQGNYIYMPPFSNIVGEYAVGAGATQAQLQAPSLKRLWNYDITPIDQNAAPATPSVYTPHYIEPFLLQPNEGLQAFITQTGGANLVNSIIVELSDGAIAPISPVGVLTIRATFTVTAGNYAWSNSLLTFSQTLPVGNYDCVGARVEVANGLFARFFPVGGINRPGVHVCQSVKDVDLPFERRGGKGVLFTFNQLTPPSIDLFHNGASGTGIVYLDLVPSSK